MAFKDISGNLRVKRVLQSSLQKERVPHSLLFYGPDGVGKKAVALVLAKALNCLQKKDDACEECASCKSINKGNFPDVMDIFTETDVIKIDQIRLIKQTAFLKPMVGNKRVYIISEAEKMNEDAANSFLKILEEPPSFTQIILVTRNPHLILPTIKSRCQAMSFSPVSREEMEKILMEKGYEKEKAKLISLFVRGNLEKALNLDWEEIQERRNHAWQNFLSLIRKEEISTLVRKYAFSRRKLIREETEELLEFFSSFCRDIMLIKYNGSPSFLFNPDYEEDMREVEKSLSLTDLQNYLDLMSFTLSGFRRNLNASLLLSSFFSNFVEREYV